MRQRKSSLIIAILIVIISVFAVKNVSFADGGTKHCDISFEQGDIEVAVLPKAFTATFTGDPEIDIPAFLEGTYAQDGYMLPGSYVTSGPYVFAYWALPDGTMFACDTDKSAVKLHPVMVPVIKLARHEKAELNSGEKVDIGDAAFYDKWYENETITVTTEEELQSATQNEVSQFILIDGDISLKSGNYFNGSKLDAVDYIIVKSGHTLTVSGTTPDLFYDYLTLDEGAKLLVRNKGILRNGQLSVSKTASVTIEEGSSTQSYNNVYTSYKNKSYSSLFNHGTVKCVRTSQTFDKYASFSFGCAGGDFYNASYASINSEYGSISLSMSTRYFADEDLNLSDEDRMRKISFINNGTLKATQNGGIYIAGTCSFTDSWEESRKYMHFINNGTIYADAQLRFSAGTEIRDCYLYNNGEINIIGNVPRAAYPYEDFHRFRDNPAMELWNTKLENAGTINITANEGTGLSMYGAYYETYGYGVENDKDLILGGLYNKSTGIINVKNKNNSQGIAIANGTTLNNYGKVTLTDTDLGKIGHNVTVVASGPIVNNGTLINNGYIGYNYDGGSAKTDIAKPGYFGSPWTGKGKDLVRYSISTDGCSYKYEPVCILKGKSYSVYVGSEKIMEDTAQKNSITLMSFSVYILPGTSTKITLYAQGYKDVTGTVKALSLTDYIKKARTGTNFSYALKTEPGKGHYDSVLKKGSTFTVNSMKYKVTTVGKEVEFVSTTSTSKTLTIPATVKYKDVTYKVTSIASKAAAKKTKITKVVIKNNVKTIGKEAFSGCKALKTLTIGTGVTTIGDKAFYNDSALTSVTIPSKVTKIGKSAFQNCKKLSKVTIKATGLKSSTVGSNAFKGIKSTAKIYVPKKQYASYVKFLVKKGVKKKQIKKK